MNNLKKALLVAIPTICSFMGGIIIGRVTKKIKPPKLKLVGNLRIDNSDVERPDSLFLELVVPVSYIKEEEVVHLKVVNESYLRK